MNFRTTALTLLPALMFAASAEAQVSATMSAMSTFGGGDGWLSPGEGGQTFLTTGSTERGIAYSTSTNHLYLVSRVGGMNVRILDGATGSDLGNLNTSGVSGGLFTLNMISVGADGAIYAADLASNTSASNPFKVYKWDTEAAAPTNVFSSPLTSSERIGDSLDAFGSGSSTVIVAGYNNTTSGYLLIDPTTGLSSTVPITGTTAGDFRSGITFAGSANKVWGDPGSPGVRKSTWSGTIGQAVTGTLENTLTLTDVVERPLDVAFINGRWVLATIEASTTSQTVNNEVRIYDVTDAVLNGTNAKTLLATGNLTTSWLSTGGNGDITWGTVNGSSATLYAMGTNNGIQAFNVTVTNVPEPTTTGLLAFAALGLALRRRR